MTVEQGMAVADWVSTTGKSLTTVYVTHGHGDHWSGLGAVRERFPGVRAVATPAVVEGMRKWSAPEVIRAFRQARFPGQIHDGNPVADPLDGQSFELEGHPLVTVDVGHTDTDDTTVLHVQDIGLVVAGDAAYNDVHQYLAESDSQGRLRPARGRRDRQRRPLRPDLRRGLRGSTPPGSRTGLDSLHEPGRSRPPVANTYIELALHADNKSRRLHCLLGGYPARPAYHRAVKQRATRHAS
jgi:glyoxylase-like metal-dependent hydrolase (beta-lactamase superfamily II)